MEIQRQKQKQIVCERCGDVMILAEYETFVKCMCSGEDKNGMDLEKNH
jgi:uncharacterized CHY-type Zn-finger protein